MVHAVSDASLDERRLVSAQIAEWGMCRSILSRGDGEAGELSVAYP